MLLTKKSYTIHYHIFFSFNPVGSAVALIGKAQEPAPTPIVVTLPPGELKCIILRLLVFVETD